MAQDQPFGHRLRISASQISSFCFSLVNGPRLGSYSETRFTAALRLERTMKGLEVFAEKMDCLLDGVQHG